MPSPPSRWPWLGDPEQIVDAAAMAGLEAGHIALYGITDTAQAVVKPDQGHARADRRAQGAADLGIIVAYTDNQHLQYNMDLSQRRRRRWRS
jgi:hypothetical protein